MINDEGKVVKHPVSWGKTNNEANMALILLLKAAKNTGSDHSGSSGTANWWSARSQGNGR